jgi:hypothetical protein
MITYSDVALTTLRRLAPNGELVSDYEWRQEVCAVMDGVAAAESRQRMFRRARAELVRLGAVVEVGERVRLRRDSDAVMPAEPGHGDGEERISVRPAELERIVAAEVERQIGALSPADTKLDWNSPYAEVIGARGYSYLQRGRKFKSDGAIYVERSEPRPAPEPSPQDNRIPPLWNSHGAALSEGARCRVCGGSQFVRVSENLFACSDCDWRRKHERIERRGNFQRVVRR